MTGWIAPIPLQEGGCKTPTRLAGKQSRDPRGITAECMQNAERRNGLHTAA